MQKKLIKAIVTRPCFLLFMLHLITGSLQVGAQDGQAKYVGYLKSIRSFLDYPDLAYRYEASLVNEATKKIADRSEGILLKHGNTYLDSNRQFLTLSANGFFMKAKLQEKLAYVYRLSTLEKKTGIKSQGMSGPVISIPDSMLLKSGVFTTVSETDVLDFRYTLNNRSGQLQAIEFRLRKKDMVILEIIIVTREGGNYTRTMRLFDFDNLHDSKKVNPDLYFKVSGSNVTMLGRLHSFKVNAFL